MAKYFNNKARLCDIHVSVEWLFLSGFTVAPEIVIKHNSYHDEIVRPICVHSYSHGLNRRRMPCILPDPILVKQYSFFS